MRLIGLPAAFAMVAVRASCYNVRPDVLAAEMPGCNVVDRQSAVVSTAVLASIIIPAKDFTSCQFNMYSRSVDLQFEADD